MKKAGKFVLEINPKIDVLLATAGFQIPTKQDKFAPFKLDPEKVIGNSIEIEEEVLRNLYTKKGDSNSVKKFNDYFIRLAARKFSTLQKVMKPNVVEVVISVSVTENRFKEVDVDNLAKCVLDCLIGIAFEDDSQVVTLICKKHIHENKINGLLVGITQLTSTRRGILGGIILFNGKTSE